jgi:hypothetical protein
MFWRYCSARPRSLMAMPLARICAIWSAMGKKGLVYGCTSRKYKKADPCTSAEGPAVLRMI